VWQCAVIFRRNNVNKSGFLSSDLSCGENYGAVIGWYDALVIAV